MRISTVRTAMQAVTIVMVSFLAGPALAQDALPYTEGPVTEVTAILTKPGKFYEYMNYLAGPYRQQQEELKKAGIIMDYGIYGTVPRQPGDPDLYLTVTYKNLAAMDNLEEKSEPSMKKIFGDRKKAAQGAADRESMRTVLGSELIRRLQLK